MSDKQIDVGIRADATGFGPAMQAAANNVRSAAENMRGSLAKMTEEAAAASTAMAVFAAAAAIGGVIAELVSHVAELGVQFAKAWQQTGIVASSLSSLAFVAESSDTSFESLVKGLEMMDRQLLSVVKGTGPAAEAFKVLGVDVKDSSGHLKDNQTLLDELADKFSKFKDGPEKTALAMRIFGRSGAEMIPILNLGSKGIKQLKDDSDALGATMSGPLIEASEQYHHTMTEMHGALQGAGNLIAGFFMPIITELAQDFAMSALEIRHWFVALGSYVAALAASVSMTFDGLGTALTQFAHGHFKAAGDAIAQIGTNVKMAWNDAATSVADDAETMYAAVRAIVSTNPLQEKGGTHNAPGLPDPTEAKSKMAEYREQWETMAEGIRTADHALGEDLTAQERAYWQGILALTTTSAADKREITHKLYELETKDAKDALDTQLAQYHEQESEVTGTAVEQARARIGIKQQELAAIIGFYGQYSKEAIAAEKAVADQTRILDKAIIDEGTKSFNQLNATLVKTFTAIGQTFKSTIGGMITGTQTFRQSIAGMLTGLVSDFANMAITMAAKWAATHLLMTGVFGSALAQRAAMQNAAAVTGSVTQKVQATGQITTDASVGAAGAASAVAAIPIVGPSLAPAAAATTFAEIMSFMSGIVASAAGGYDIPANINPVTQLHAQEMVLPAPLADKIRGMDGGGRGTTIIQAMDVKSFHDFLQSNHSAVGAAVKKQIKMGSLALTPAAMLR